MMTFRGKILYNSYPLEMRKNVEKLIVEIERDSQSVDNILQNLSSLDYVLNKIVYLKSHSVNMMFKDAIVLKKEQVDQMTKDRGMLALRGLMQNAL